jgi:hypothetical protein
MYISLAILFIAAVILGILLWKQHQLLKTFMRGKKGAALEDTLQWLIEKHAQVDDTLKAHKEALEHIDGRVEQCVRTPEIIKFNAEPNLGSEQSFATTILNEQGDGFILSALTHRNHLGLYTKKVIKFTPTVTLTEEEKEVLTTAKKSSK